MTIEDVVRHFGNGSNACSQIGYSRQAFGNWRARGFIPLSAQLRFEYVTKGKLKADSFELVESYKKKIKGTKK